jgi:hypothetical protein
MHILWRYTCTHSFWIRVHMSDYMLVSDPIMCHVIRTDVGMD